jgi:hypothetical protein
MNSGWRTRRRREVSSPAKPSDAFGDNEREGHLRAVARMHRPKLVRRQPPTADVSEQIRRAELHVAMLKDGAMTPALAEISSQLDLQHEAEDNDEIILCRMLGGSVISTTRGALVAYNPRSAQSIPEWPNCIALEPEGVHARRAYKKNIETIKMMVEITEINVDEVKFICALFFIIQPRESDYLCYGQFRYPIDNAVVSYEDSCVYFADGSSIEIKKIGIFDFYLTAYYRTRTWLEMAG